MSGAPSPTSQPGPSRSEARVRLGILGVLVLVLLIALGSLAWLSMTRTVDALGIKGESAQIQEERDLVRARAEQFLLRMGTYGPDQLTEDGTMPEYRELVTEMITPKFATSFSEQVSVAEQLVAQAQQTRSAQVFGSGVAAIDEDTATALVAGAFTDSYGESEPQAPSAFRLEVALVKVDGEWLVDSFVPVGGGDSGSPEPQPGEEQP